MLRILVLKLLCTGLFIIVEACFLTASLDVPRVITVPLLKSSILAAFLVFGLEVEHAPMLAFADMKICVDFLVGRTTCRGIQHDQPRLVKEAL